MGNTSINKVNADVSSDVTNEESYSVRFTDMVLKEFNGNVAGGLQVTNYQRQLIQGYFIGIDRTLKTADEGRLRKNENNSDRKFDNTLPITWKNVNLTALALDIINYARMGLDMMQANHLSAVPYKNKKTQKYDVTLIPGYNGIKYIAEKYALDKPADVTIELVYSTDTFKPLKKSGTNAIESYEFEINNPFDRGEVKGGFGYIEYSNSIKNKLVIMSMKDILKRRPEKAAVEFWGGEKDEYDKGKKTGKKIKIEGWFEEMCIKTIAREVYSAKHIPRDPKKIDDSYQHMILSEARIAQMQTQEEIIENANQMPIDITPSVAKLNEPMPAQEIKSQPYVDKETGEILNVRTVNEKAASAATMPEGLGF